MPGWLTIKARLADLSAAGINIKSFYVPITEEEKTAFFSLDFRLNVQDQHLIKNGYLNDWCEQIETLEDVRFRVYLEKKTTDGFQSLFSKDYIEFSISDQTTDEGVFLGNYNWSEWFGDARVL